MLFVNGIFQHNIDPILRDDFHILSLELRDGEFWYVGDDVNHSAYGLVDRHQIKGKVIY